MLKQEYAQHIVEMSQRVRCEEWAELEKNKEDFFETGNTWALSWLGHLTVLDAAMYHYTGKAEWLERVKECLGIFFSVQDELVQRYEDGSLPFIEGDARISRLNELARAEIDNTYELLRLMDGEPGAFFPIVADDAHEDAFLLSAQLPRQLVQKAQIMLAHMRDVDKIYESKNK